MENEPFEYVFPIEHVDFPLPCEFAGVYPPIDGYFISLFTVFYTLIPVPHRIHVCYINIYIDIYLHLADCGKCR